MTKPVASRAAPGRAFKKIAAYLRMLGIPADAKPDREAGVNKRSSGRRLSRGPSGQGPESAAGSGVVSGHEGGADAGKCRPSRKKLDEFQHYKDRSPPWIKTANGYAPADGHPKASDDPADDDAWQSANAQRIFFLGG